MREYTNLEWPERPFGVGNALRRDDTLVAFVLDWAPQPDWIPMPVCVATVYLPISSARAVEIDSDTFVYKFRATVIGNPAEVPRQFALIDRTLGRAYRYATILTGHRLSEDLNRIARLSTTSLPGLGDVLAAWRNHDAVEPGDPRIVDTGEASADTTLDMPYGILNTSPPLDAKSRDITARAALGRCLAVGIAAGSHVGCYNWEGAFEVEKVTDRVTADVLAGTVIPDEECVDDDPADEDE